MAAVIMLLQNAVGQSWLPHGVKVYEEERELAGQVFSRTMVFLLAGSGLVITGFVALAQEVLFVLVPPTYYASFWAIPFLAVGFLFFTSAHVSVVAIMVKNKTVYIMIACWVVATLNIGFNALLIPRFGIVGAGAATGLAYILFAFSYALISGRLWAVSYPLKVVAALLALPLASIGLIVLIAYSGPGVWINLLLKLLVTLLCGSALLLVVMRAEGLRLAELIAVVKKMVRQRG
jgi:O-antigen/teichoic acid export membrane protein